MSEISSDQSIGTARRFLFAVLPYLVVTLTCFVVLYHSYDLSEISIAYPFSYEGDQLSMSSMIKGMSETGSWWYNPRLGGEFGQSLEAYPYVDALSLGMMLLISFFTDNPFLIYNLFFFSTFFLCGYSALFALKKMGVDSLSATVCAVLFAFLPFHMMRYPHLLLTAYFMVPLVVLVMFWLLNGACVYARDKSASLFRAIFTNKTLVISLVICFLASSTGIYCAFFTGFFLVVVEIMLLFRREKGGKRPVLPLVFIAVLVAGVVLNYLPNMIFAAMGGGSGGTGQSSIRPPFDAEFYAFMLVTLLFPRAGHRSEALSGIAERYTNSTLYLNENQTATLGIIGAIGLLALLFLLFRRGKKSDGPLMKCAMDLSTFNVAGILLGTAGGIGAVLAYTLNTGIIRCYNRLSIFIGFFALALIGLAFTALNRKLRVDTARWKQSLAAVGAGLIVLFGIWDQTMTVFHGSEDQEEIIRKVDSDREFVERVEDRVAEGALVFELPYSSYPWGPEYPLLKGYLYSDSLVWSFGGILDSTADRWAKEVSSLPPDEMVQRLRNEGYSGIYIDKDVYAALSNSSSDDSGADVEELSVTKEFEALLGAPLTSSDNTKLFYLF